MDRLSRSAGNLGLFGPSNVASTRAALREQQLTLPFRAPRTVLNVPIGGARRRAAQSWSLQRIKAAKNAAGVVMDGQALNITLVSNADNLNFGWSDAAAMSRTCSACSGIWRRHWKISNKPWACDPTPQLI